MFLQGHYKNTSIWFIWTHLCSQYNEFPESTLPARIERKCRAVSAAVLCETFCSQGWPPGSLPHRRKAQPLQGKSHDRWQAEGRNDWTDKGIHSLYLGERDLFYWLLLNWLQPGAEQCVCTWKTRTRETWWEDWSSSAGLTCWRLRVCWYGTPLSSSPFALQTTGSRSVDWNPLFYTKRRGFSDDSHRHIQWNLQPHINCQ